MRLFCFGLGYSARRIIARGRSVEASGTTREPEAARAWRRDGVAAFAFDGASGDAALLPALARAQVAARQRAARRERRSRARAFRGGEIAAAPDLERRRLSLQRRRLRRPRRGLGRRGERAFAEFAARGGGSPPRANGARSARRGASRSISCGSPAFTGPAATRSRSCAPARRGASSSRARSSTASMSTTSPRSPGA